MSMEGDTQARPIEPSGVPGLDVVLGGGIQQGALVLIVGSPGSGKTTLAAQIACTAVRAGRRALIVTAYSEPPTKLISHLRSFSFFVDDMLGSDLQIQSLQQFLPRGLATTADEIRSEVWRTHINLLVLDGFRGMRGADPHAARLFLYELGTALSLLQTTTIVTSEAPPRDAALFPEVTTADVLLGLYDHLHGVRARRGLEVIKVRGAAPLSGLHTLTLTPHGTVVAPRLEARVVATGMEEDEDQEEEGVAVPPAEEARRRARFDLPELDALLDGGLTRLTPTLVLGSPGTGKTLLGLCFVLAGLRAGEPAVFLGFHETRRELLQKADTFGLGQELRRALAPGGDLTLVRQPPVEREPDVVADDLLAALDRSGARRLVIDSLSTIERAVGEAGDSRRLANYLGALVEALRERGVTSLFLKESRALAAATLGLDTDLVSLVAANVIWLQRVAYGDRLHRVLSVPKMRFSAHDVTLREFTITAPAGLRVLAPFASDRGALQAIARHQSVSQLSHAEDDISPVEQEEPPPGGIGR